MVCYNIPHTLSCQSNIDKLREVRKVGRQWLSGHSQTVRPQFDAHQGLSEQALDSGSEAIQPKVDSTKWLPLSISPDGARFLASPKAFLDKASNSIVILISKITVPTKSYFGKMSITQTCLFNALKRVNAIFAPSGDHAGCEPPDAPVSSIKLRPSESIT